MKKKFFEYKKECGSFDISKDNNDESYITYIDTERFIAQTLYTDKKSFAEFPDEIISLYKSTFADPLVMEKYATGVTKTPEEFELIVKNHSLRASNKYPFSAFIITDKETDNIVGYEIIDDGNKDSTGEATYLISKDYQRSDRLDNVCYENVGALILGYGSKLYNGGTLVNKVYNDKTKKFEGGQIFKTVSATTCTDDIRSSKILSNLGFTKIGYIVKFDHLRNEFELNFNKFAQNDSELGGEYSNGFEY